MNTKELLEFWNNYALSPGTLGKLEALTNDLLENNVGGYAFRVETMHLTKCNDNTAWEYWAKAKGQ